MRTAGCIWALLLIAASPTRAADIVYLKGALRGTPSTVLEETDAYVLVKIPKSEVVRIERSAASAVPPEASAKDTQPAPVSSRGAPKAETQHEATAESQEPDKRETGSAVGRMLWKGRPVAGCRVKVLLLSTLGFLKVTKLNDVGREDISDKGGFYRFEELPPGRYKLYWVPPGGSHWIRRLRLNPDFEVRPNEQTDIGTLEIRVTTLN